MVRCLRSVQMQNTEPEYRNNVVAELVEVQQLSTYETPPNLVHLKHTYTIYPFDTTQPQ